MCVTYLEYKNTLWILLTIQKCRPICPFLETPLMFFFILIFLPAKGRNKTNIQHTISLFLLHFLLMCCLRANFLPFVGQTSLTACSPLPGLRSQSMPVEYQTCNLSAMLHMGICDISGFVRLALGLNRYRWAMYYLIK